jgi:copper chaperone CopZ
MKIEVLYFDECPNHSPAVDRIREVLKEEGISAHVSEVKVADERAAQAIGFLGSPSIRVDGVDVEPAARSSKDYGMMCRTYLEGGKRVGVPSSESIRAAIREAVQAQPTHNCCPPQVALTQQSGSVEPKRKWLLGASVAAAIAASLCCILPILTAVTGFGVLATGAALEKYRPYFLSVTGLLLTGGFVLAYRDYKEACKPGSVCATKPMNRWNFIALGTVAALVIGLAAFPYYSGAVTHALVGAPPNNTVGSGALATVTFQVPDMDCPACAVVLAATFQKLPGVTDAKLDVDNRKAVVTYSPGSQNIATLEKVISDAGFHVASASQS